MNVSNFFNNFVKGILWTIFVVILILIGTGAFLIVEEKWKARSEQKATSVLQEQAQALEDFNARFTNIFTITNRSYLLFPPASAVVRVTDEEWNILTNAFPTNLIDKEIRFFKEK